MSPSPALAALVSVTPRFARSVALVRDAGRCDALDGYLLTPSGRDILRRLAAALRGEITTRAWSVTGPYGSGKDGVLPVLLAAALAHAHSRVALYEDGSFVPKPNAAAFERLFRAPGKFELQRFTLAGPRAEAFRRYAAMIQRTAGGDADLLTVVKPMLRLAKDLPEYVTKTKAVGDDARRVLKAVREARQPDKLLFADLPAACECQAIESSGTADAAGLDGYAARRVASACKFPNCTPLHRRTRTVRVLRSRSILRVNGAVLDVEGFALSI